MMNSSSEKRSSVDEYIFSHETETQKRLMQLRRLVFVACPDAVESISYGMPAYKLHKKPLIYFAAFTHHIGVYATPSAHGAFMQELKIYKQGKGSVQFPYAQPLPLGLIEKMVKYKRDEIVASKKF